LQIYRGPAEKVFPPLLFRSLGHNKGWEILRRQQKAKANTKKKITRIVHKISKVMQNTFKYVLHTFAFVVWPFGGVLGAWGRVGKIEPILAETHLRLGIHT